MQTAAAKHVPVRTVSRTVWRRTGCFWRDAIVRAGRSSQSEREREGDGCPADTAEPLFYHMAAQSGLAPMPAPTTRPTMLPPPPSARPPHALHHAACPPARLSASTHCVVIALQHARPRCPRPAAPSRGRFVSATPHGRNAHRRAPLPPPILSSTPGTGNTTTVLFFVASSARTKRALTPRSSFRYSRSRVALLRPPAPHHRRQWSPRHRTTCCPTTH